MMPQFDIPVTPEMIRHSRILDILYFTGFAYAVAVPVILLNTRLAARLRDTAARVTRNAFVQSLIFVALLIVVSTIMEFPLAYYAGFVVPHEFNLSNQNLAQWLGDELKALAVSVVLTSIIGALAFLAIRRIKRWWFAMWLGSIPIAALLIVIAPIFIDPIFNKFEPLKDPVLKKRLLDEAALAGIEGSRVYQVDKSKQTKTLNAYVTGLGPTTRIVMWDTLLAAMTQDEIIAVMGHEMGHYVLHHLWKGLAATVVGLFATFFVAQLAFDYGIAKWGRRWSVTGGDPAALTWLLVIITIITFLGEPISNGVSRYIEHEADVFGLELTHLNAPLATALIKLAETSKTNPRPNRFIEFWRYSHPSIARRVDFVLRYKPRSDAPRYVAQPFRQQLAQRH